MRRRRSLCPAASSRSAAASSASRAERAGLAPRGISAGPAPLSWAARALLSRERGAHRTSRVCSPCARGRCSKLRFGTLRSCLTSCWSTQPAAIIRAAPAWLFIWVPCSTYRRLESHIACYLPTASGRRTSRARRVPSFSRVSAWATGFAPAAGRGHWRCTPPGEPIRTLRSPSCARSSERGEHQSPSARQGVWRERREPGSSCRVGPEEVVE